MTIFQRNESQTYPIVPLISRIAFIILVALGTTSSGFAQSFDLVDVRWTGGMLQYRGLLKHYEDGSGIMRVKYYGEECGCTKMVEQIMLPESTPLGFRLKGLNPTYPGSLIRYPNYSADNLYISRDENGNWKYFILDDQNALAEANAREIISPGLILRSLREFKW